MLIMENLKFSLNGIRSNELRRTELIRLPFFPFTVFLELILLQGVFALSAFVDGNVDWARSLCFVRPLLMLSSSSPKVDEPEDDSESEL
mmetsp:Transcript_25090/g.56049  ORF Transcript_25090/g.56049 Transcript_25090/m.56049 type:complete len:89 (-) Transcript_25090:429-695(-)